MLKRGLIAHANIYRVVKGKVVEGWAVEDWLDFLNQLGVIDYKGFLDETTS